MKRFLLVVLSLLAATEIFAQNVNISGTVLSSVDSTALAGTVISINDGQYHAVAGRGGRFIMERFPRKQSKFTFTFMGFEPHTVTINPKEGTYNFGTIYLNPTSSEFESVIIAAQAPISVQKGDTIQFNADAFKTNPDADADELVAKMPGIIIQEGKVEAQGEPVRKIYIDGKLYFGTDPMAALKSLPADAIENIQLFDELSDQARISGVDDGESNKVMNIVTRSKAKRSTMLRAEASAGMDLTPESKAFRYLTGGNISRFEERKKLTVTALSNNVNSTRFGQSDVTTDSDVDSNGNPVNQMVGVQNIGGLGANYSYESKNKGLQFSGNYFYDYNYSQIENRGENIFYPLKDRFLSKENLYYNVYNTERNNHRVNFRLEANLSPNDIIIINPAVSFTTLNSYQENNSPRVNFSQMSQAGINPNNGTINNTNNRIWVANPYENNAFYMSGDATYTHRFEKRGRNITANLRYRINERDNNSLYIEDEKNTYSNGKWSNAGNLINRKIQQDISSNSLRLKMTYSEPFATYHRVVFSVVGSNDWDINNRQGRRYNDDTGLYDIKEFNQTNNFNTDYYSMGGGLGYSYVDKKITISTGVDYLRLFQTRNEYEPNLVTTKLQFNDFQPSFSLRYSLYKKKYLRIQYNGRTRLPSASQMQRVADMRHPNNITIGNPDLSPGYQHSMTLFYNSSNTYRSTNFTLTLNATTISNFIAQETGVNMDPLFTIDGDTIMVGAMMNQTVNLDGYMSGKVTAIYSMAIKPLRSTLNLTGSLSYIRTPSVYGVLNYANISSGNIRIGLTSNISQNIDFNFYTSTTFNYAANSTRDNTSFLTENLSYSLNWIFGPGFVFNTLLTWKYYDSSTSASLKHVNQYLINVGIGKKFLKRRNAEFRITLYDALNQNRNLLHYIRNNSIQDVETNTLGRYVLGRFSYRFNSMVHRKKGGNAAGTGKQGGSSGASGEKKMDRAADAAARSGGTGLGQRQGQGRGAGTGTRGTGGGAGRQ